MQKFLTPVLALIVWTFVMWVVMYSRRIPAMRKLNKDTQAFIRNPKLKEELPDKTRWAIDNYNHLHEQPVLFYALMGYLYMTEHTTPFFLGLAWAYVGIRIVHSIVQVTANHVLLRFFLFGIGSICLMAMTLAVVAGLF